jgi:hypothetical protein
MWITFSLFLQYSYISASVQCENCSHNDKSFPSIPNMPGSIGPRWFELRLPYNSGSVHTTISNVWIIISFTIYSNSYKNWLQITSFSVFIESFSSLITKHNWRHNRHLWMGRLQHPTLADVILGGGWGCVLPSKLSYVPVMMNCHNIAVFWGPYTPLTAPKITSACSGGCCLSIHCTGAERKASCGALGHHFCWWRSWLAMVVLVDVGCWRLMSDQSTVGIVKFVCGSFLRISYTFLTSDPAAK